jgi:opacity protein-like surface antigen
MLIGSPRRRASPKRGALAMGGIEGPHKMRSYAEKKGRRRAGWRGALGALFLVSSPALAGPPYRTDDPEPVDYQHFEFFTFSTGTRISRDTSGDTPAIEFDYGIVPNGRVAIIAPMAFDRAAGEPFNWGYGDTDIEFKYRPVEQDKNGWRPSVGVVPSVEIRSGDVHRGLGNGVTRVFLPMWLQKDFGDWTTYGGGGYWINHGPGNKNFWYGGWVLQRKITDKLAIGAELFHQTADKIDKKDQTGFNVAAIYDFTDHYHLLFSMGRGIRHAKETNEFSWYIGLLVTDAVEKPSGQNPPEVSHMTGGAEKTPEKNTSDIFPPAFATGFYIGADLGHAWQRANETDMIGCVGPFLSSYSLKGPIGGPFTGFNWRMGSVVLGVEADVEAAGATGGEGPLLVGMAQRHDVRGSARGRIGIAADRALFYATGGAALANFFPFALGEPFNQARPGWTIGAGIEYAIADDWSARLEYRHSDFGSATYDSANFDGNLYRIHVRDQAVRVGLAYHFNFAEPDRSSRDADTPR